MNEHTLGYWSDKADQHHADLQKLILEYDEADGQQDNARCRILSEQIKAKEAEIWNAEEMFDLAMSSQPLPKELWIERARAEAQRLWAYADLISDHPEAVDHAHISGEAPETFAKELGEELELTSISEWNFGF